MKQQSKDIKNSILKVSVILQILFVIVLTLIMPNASAQKNTVDSVITTQKTNLSENKKLVIELFDEIINKRNLSHFDKVYIPGAVDHSAWEGQRPGTAGMKEAVRGLFEVFSALKVTVEDIFAEGDKVATREKWEGTKTSSGKQSSGSVIHIFQIENGKVISEWSKGWEWLDKP